MRKTVKRSIPTVGRSGWLNQPIEFVYHPSFDEPGVAESILAPMPGAADFEAERSALRVPNNVPPELARLYEMPLLSREQESHQFRKMNYLKHLLNLAGDHLRRASDQMGIEPPQEELFRRVMALQAGVNRVRDDLIACNMRLVVAIAKRHARWSENFFEVLSDGNVSLMRAVDRFDFSRGTKFSTYASWAMVKNFSRSVPEERHHHERYLTGRDDIFDAAWNTRADLAEQIIAAEQAATRVNRLLEQLEPREREIIRLRAGLDASEGMTLQQIGQRLGITKERVRQLNVRIMKKLRVIAEQHAADLE